METPPRTVMDFLNIDGSCIRGIRGIRRHPRASFLELHQRLHWKHQPSVLQSLKREVFKRWAREVKIAQCRFEVPVVSLEPDGSVTLKEETHYWV